MKSSTLLTLAGLLGGLLSTSAPGLAQQSGAPAGNVANGKKLFETVGCYQCHGYVGQGALQTGPRISRTSLPFDAFLHQLRQPMYQMAPYEAAVLPDSAVADLYAYVKQLPEPPQVKDVPLLNTCAR